MSFTGLVLTSAGKDEIVKAGMGERFQITAIAFGEGICTGNFGEQEELAEQVIRLPATRVERDRHNADAVCVECDFSSKDIPRAFFFREVGIIANERLCYYDNSGENAEYLNPESDVLIKQKRMRFILHISGETNVSVTVGSGLYAEKEEVDQAFEEHRKSGDHDGRYLLKENVVNDNTVTEPGYALDARQANPNMKGSLAEKVDLLYQEILNTATDGDIDNIINGTYVDSDDSNIFETASNEDIDDIIAGVYIPGEEDDSSVIYGEIEDMVDRLF